MSKTGGERGHAHSPVQVEMAGVEPASREFEQGHPTSLVDLLCLACLAAGQQATRQASRCGAYGVPASDPTYRRLWEGTPGLLTPADLSPGSGKGQT
jgi:hypothetical protein